MFDVNLAASVNKMLCNCDDIIRQHKAACLRVTSLLACKDLIWIGTSAGVILTIAATFSPRAGSVEQPIVTGTDHNSAVAKTKGWPRFSFQAFRTVTRVMWDFWLVLNTWELPRMHHLVGMLRNQRPKRKTAHRKRPRRRPNRMLNRICWLCPAAMVLKIFEIPAEIRWMKWPGGRIVQIICCYGTFKWWPQLPYLRLDATNIDFVHEFYVIFRSKRLSFVDCFGWRFRDFCFESECRHRHFGMKMLFNGVFEEPLREFRGFAVFFLEILDLIGIFISGVVVFGGHSALLVDSYIFTVQATHWGPPSTQSPIINLNINLFVLEYHLINHSNSVLACESLPYVYFNLFWIFFYSNFLN